MTCKDCLHLTICDYLASVEGNNIMFWYEAAEKCSFFKNKSHFMELPCRVGETVYYIKSAFSYLEAPKAEIVRKIELMDEQIVFRTVNRCFNIENIGKTVFLSREEAEKALKEQVGEE